MSPSGSGVHVWFENDGGDAGIPSWWSDQHLTDAEHEGVEAYDVKFMTVTGDLLFGERADDFPSDVPDEYATTEVGSIDADEL
ncbi:hypothetical protein BRC77_13150, partial [Halobacteriales archaeon QH_8_64_26]